MDNQPVITTVVTTQPVTDPPPSSGSAETNTDTVTLPGGVKMPKAYAYGLGILGILLLLR